MGGIDLWHITLNGLCVSRCLRQLFKNKATSTGLFHRNPYSAFYNNINAPFLAFIGVNED
jgi:hypothetical protein